MSDWIPPYYNKLGKKVKDLLGKKFEIKNELKTINKSANGVTLESSFNGDGAVSGASKGTYKPGCYEVEGVFKTANEVNLKVASKKLVPGLEVSLQGKSKKQQVILDAKYAQPFYAGSATLTTDVGKENYDTSINGSFMIGFDGLSVGVNGVVDFAADDKLKDYNCGAEYTQDDLTISLFTQSLGSKITASYWQKLSGDCNLAASLQMDPDAGKGAAHVLTVGVEHRLDSATMLAAKMNTCGTVNTNIEHILNSPSVKLSIGASFDAKKASACCTPDKFGIACTLGDF